MNSSHKYLLPVFSGEFTEHFSTRRTISDIYETASFQISHPAIPS
jgi:hypothetical protein